MNKLLSGLAVAFPIVAAAVTYNFYGNSERLLVAKAEQSVATSPAVQNASYPIYRPGFNHG